MLQAGCRQAWLVYLNLPFKEVSMPVAAVSPSDWEP
jgi:hypothetical protein